MKRKTVKLLLLLLLAVCLLAGCGEKTPELPGGEEPGQAELPASAMNTGGEDRRDAPDETATDGTEQQPDDAETAGEPEETEEPGEAEEPEEAEEPQASEDQKPAKHTGEGICVAIDAGHQLHGNSEKEPIGPGASETKAKVASGTAGCVTGLTEYQLNLNVSLLLRDELVKRGYRVVMIRETNDVNISNSERAKLAEDAGADIFVRVHANSDNNSSIRGALTICMTAQNRYNGSLYRESRRLSDSVLDGLVAATGFQKRSVWETDTMSGINWAAMPVTIVEMGFMSNPDEDRTMATPEFQRSAALGIANGIDAYFGAALPESAKPAQPEDAKPEDSKPEDTKPEESAPEDSGPEESAPAEGTPEDDTPESGET